MITTKKLLPAIPARTVVRIPLGGKTNSFAALLKEIKNQNVPATAKLRFLRTSSGTAARLEYPTHLAA